MISYCRIPDIAAVSYPHLYLHIKLAITQACLLATLESETLSLSRLLLGDRGHRRCIGSVFRFQEGLIGRRPLRPPLPTIFSRSCSTAHISVREIETPIVTIVVI